MFLVNISSIIILVVVLLLVVIIGSQSLKIVPQSENYVIENMGKFKKILGSGPSFIIPFFDRVRSKISIKEKVCDFDPQPVITKDNVTIEIDSVVYFFVSDPKLYTYGIQNPMSAVENLTATTLRNIIGELDLDQTLTSRDVINSKMRSIIDEATDAWGIKVTRVELKNITPPQTIQLAMEKQMKAERERREAILKAEGEKQSTILVAEGEKESAILRAEAKKAAIIAEAEGRAAALAAHYKAQAEGIKAIKEADPNQTYVTLKGLEALEKLGSSESTKLIIPSNLQDITALTSSIVETVKTTKTSKNDKK